MKPYNGINQLRVYASAGFDCSLQKQLSIDSTDSVGMNLPQIDHLDSLILLIRNRKVMLSLHLAKLYGAEPRTLMQAVRRNLDRFPDDFMFELTHEELNSLRSQNVILEARGKGGYSKYLPYAFTQEGVAMLSSVLRSPQAVHANIAIMRTFVKLRELMVSHRDLAQKIEVLERKYDAQFKVVFNSIRELINAKPKNLIQVPSPKRKLGFGSD